MDIQSDKISYVFHVASSQSGYATRCNQELSCHLFSFSIEIFFRQIFHNISDHEAFLETKIKKEEWEDYSQSLHHP
jgi:hypothetical protein